jgi:hypothetical protein
LLSALARLAIRLTSHANLQCTVMIVKLRYVATLELLARKILRVRALKFRDGNSIQGNVNSNESAVAITLPEGKESADPPLLNSIECYLHTSVLKGFPAFAVRWSQEHQPHPNEQVRAR